jgi:hypothetical protein
MRGMAIPQETTMASSKALGPVMSIPPKTHIRVPFTAVHAWAHLLPEMQSTANTCRTHASLREQNFRMIGRNEPLVHQTPRACCPLRIEDIWPPRLGRGGKIAEPSISCIEDFGGIQSLGLGGNLVKSAAHLTC